MIQLFAEYGLFLAKAITILVFIFVLILMIFSFSKKAKSDDHFEITNLNKKYKNMADSLRLALLPKKELKKALKETKKETKKEKKLQHKQEKNAPESNKKRIFVLNFLGNIKATAVKHLRKEITAILSVANSNDEVVVCLENAGGLVHEHGFASSQLLRIKQKGIPLTVAVDKVAASGGYMMACVADKIIAAPFAIVGSIGVIAQLPNFNRLLDKHGVDFELMKAGELKRTVTMFGKNTDEDRAHFNEQLEDTHDLFKEFVKENRPALEMEKVATGEHWLATRGIELKLVDELITSDDYLLNACNDADIYEIQYELPKTISEKLSGSVQMTIDKLFFSWWQKERDSKLFN